MRFVAIDCYCQSSLLWQMSSSQLFRNYNIIITRDFSRILRVHIYTEECLTTFQFWQKLCDFESKDIRNFILSATFSLCTLIVSDKRHKTYWQVYSVSSDATRRLLWRLPLSASWEKMSNQSSMWPPLAAHVPDSKDAHYPRENEGLCFYRCWLVCLSVCLSVCLLPR